MPNSICGGSQNGSLNLLIIQDSGYSFHYFNSGEGITIARNETYGYKDFVMPSEKTTIAISNSITELDMVLKTILKKLIKEKGISIAHLSRASKVPIQTLHGWLNGSEPKNLRQVKSVADYLQVDLDYLCFGIKPKQVQPQLEEFENEINAGIFEVVLRRVKK